MTLILLAAIVAGFMSGCEKKEDTSDMELSFTVCDAEMFYPIDMENVSNASLLPEIVPDDMVNLEKNGSVQTPDWFKSVIMVEFRVETATKEGTFQAAVPLLDHYAELGVNCLWLTPIYEKGPGGNGYGNIGLHSVEPAMTGTSDYEEGWQVVKNFVDEAHKRNIRILFDVITWGVMNGSPLINEHPEFFEGEAWGNTAYNWKSAELREWFVENAVRNIAVTGADGYRCDCEPNYSGYDVFGEIRNRLLEKGRKIVVISEDGNERNGVYDCEQDGVLPYHIMSRGGLYQNPVPFYLGDSKMNIVDSVKNGTGLGSESLQKKDSGGNFRFYTCCVTNHDYQQRLVNGNIIIMGYQAILAPFIPVWYMGDECGVTMKNRAVLFDVPVDFSCMEEAKNRKFYNDVKQLINIRRTYKDIFEYFPENHRESNICEVRTTGITSLQSYARYSKNAAVIVIANDNLSSDGNFTAEIPYVEMGFGKGTYRITNLLSGNVLSEGRGREVNMISGKVKYGRIGVYLIEKTE